MKQFTILAAATVLYVGMFGATGANAQSFRLCEGEYWEPWKGGKCPLSEPYAYCYTAAQEATRICRAQGSTGKPLMVQMRGVPGHKCGYGYWTVTCQ